MKVLVCGDRNWSCADTIRRRLEELPDGTIIIEGGARGADTIAGNVAGALGLQVRVVMADWKQFGRAAGPIRNRKMLDMLDPTEDKVWAFHPDLSKSKGTADTVREARSRGIYVEVIAPDPAKV